MSAYHSQTTSVLHTLSCPTVENTYLKLIQLVTISDKDDGILILCAIVSVLFHAAKLLTALPALIYNLLDAHYNGKCSRQTSRKTTEEYRQLTSTAKLLLTPTPVLITVRYLPVRPLHATFQRGHLPTRLLDDGILRQQLDLHDLYLLLLHLDDPKAVNAQTAHRLPTNHPILDSVPFLCGQTFQGIALNGMARTNCVPLL